MLSYLKRLPLDARLLLVCGILATAHASAAATTVSSVKGGNAILDQFQDAYAAYALVRLGSGYSGPALRVRRGSDNSEKDIGFSADGRLEAGELESWLSGADGYVVKWYSQISGKPDLVQSDRSRQPRIAISGTVTKDSSGRYSIKFDAERNTYLDPESGFSESYKLYDMLAMMVGEVTDGSAQQIIGFQHRGAFSQHALSVRLLDGSFVVRGNVIESILYNVFSRKSSAWIINSDGKNLVAFSNNYESGSRSIVEQQTKNFLRVGADTKAGDTGFNGFFSALLMFPGQSRTEDILDRYDSLNGALGIGPENYSRTALLPQSEQWQIDLYNWLKTITVDDVRIPGREFSKDISSLDIDTIADIWLQLEGLSVSRVVRGEPEWYVLDAGNGKGIEATGTVRIWHEPEKGHGNPPRSWSNEPAFLYQLSIPTANGGEGNPYYHFRPLGLRALVVAAVDMLMYSDVKDDYAQWTDMHGKALLGWAETYRWTKRELPEDIRKAFERGFRLFLDRIIANGARGVNTNMDMFAMQAAAEIYMATEDPELKEKAIQSVRRVLFGYPDGSLFGKHDTWTNTKNPSRGVYSPAGYIMEGGQPDVFYQGESMYHLTGALAALTDRKTGRLAPGWEFLRDVVEQMETWFVYQAFPDPARSSERGVSPAHYYHGGAGFTGRTGAPFPAGQADFIWRNLTIADYFEIGRHRLYSASTGHLSHSSSLRLPSRSKMTQAIVDQLNSVESAMGKTVSGSPGEWNGWSPWTKPTPYLPNEGWYSRLSDLVDRQHSSIALPIDRENFYYSRSFGGPPLGPEYWVHKATDGERDFGWYIEAQANQGPYGGWYGGKIETFWTSSTGVVLLNRHGKGGCGDKFEDSSCWDNLEYRAAHHVWGRDENGRGFTPLHITNEDANVRTASFDLDGSPPSVEVVNHFNTPGNDGEGEQSADVLGGKVSLTNRFEARGNGIAAMHRLESDGKDEISELWLSLPIFLRSHRLGQWGYQSKLDDTSIEYYDGQKWRSMPEDTDGDGVPEFVDASVLRLGRDFQLGDGIQYAYIVFTESQRMRLSSRIYSDPYQTRTLVRTVLVDLHGNPGSQRKMPTSREIQYSLLTSDETVEYPKQTKGVRQDIKLSSGWNLVSRYVQPSSTSLDGLLGPYKSCVALLKDEAGKVYSPSEGIDQIGEWTPGRAYEIFARVDCSISLSGTELSSVSVPLKRGWNLIGYPYQMPQDVTSVLSSLSDVSVRMEDEDGNVYDPSEGVESLKEMRPGEGYKIYVDKDVTLTFSDPN